MGWGKGRTQVSCPSKKLWKGFLCVAPRTWLWELGVHLCHSTMCQGADFCLPQYKDSNKTKSVPTFPFKQLKQLRFPNCDGHLPNFGTAQCLSMCCSGHPSTLKQRRRSFLTLPFPATMQCQKEGTDLGGGAGGSKQQGQTSASILFPGLPEKSTAPHPVLPTWGSMGCALRRRKQKVQTGQPKLMLLSSAPPAASSPCPA